MEKHTCQAFQILMVVGEDTSKVGDEGSYMVRREELDGRAKRRKASGKQLGDRSKAARAMLQVIDNDAPPAHRLLGSDVLALVRAKFADLQEELAQWEHLTRSTSG